MKKKIFIFVVIALFIITPVVLIANSTKNVDCAVGEFRDFSGCSNTCGGGTQTRSRTVITPKSGNGKDCPPLSERRPCNTQVCPVDCKVSGFSDFSDCTRECGGGTQTRTKTIIQNQVGTGAPCPELSNTIACNTEPCLIDIISPSDTIIGIGDTPPGSCINEVGGFAEYSDISTLGLSGIFKSARLRANILLNGGPEQRIRFGVYFKRTSDEVFVPLTQYTIITRDTIDFVEFDSESIDREIPVAPFRFVSGDKIGVFIDRPFCASITNPRVTIQYTNV